MDEIHHNRPDAYYRCLWYLPKAKLDKLPGLADQKDNKILQGFLPKRALTDDDENMVAPVADAEDALAIPDIDLQVAPIVPAAVDINAHLWRRVLVDAGEGSFSVKVYFDFETHHSGRQRGWVDCKRLNVSHYNFCEGNKAEYCARMYLWAREGEENVNRERATHILWSPEGADVTATVAMLRMTEF